MVHLGNLVELVLTIKRAAGDAVISGELQVAEHLLRVGVDHLLGEVGLILEVEVSSKSGQDELHLSLCGTVEAAAEGREQADDHGVRVGLDSVEGLNSGEQRLPLVELLDHCRQIGDKEGGLLGPNSYLMVNELAHGTEGGKVVNGGAEVLSEVLVSAWLHKLSLGGVKVGHLNDFW